MELESAKVPTIEYSNRWDLGVCYMCGEKITEETRRAYPAWTYRKRKMRYCYVEPICPHCLHMTAAIQEAEDERRRFTKVSVAIDGTALASYSGSRCLCGGAALETKGICVQCWKAQRMLGKIQSHIKSIRKMTTQLNKQLKEMNNGAQ